MAKFTLEILLYLIDHCMKILNRIHGFFNGKIRSIVEKKILLKGEQKIQNYINNLKPNEELRVILGGHWSNNLRWLILDKVDQDITQRLNFKNNSVDVIFNEHVLEHISFIDAISFFKEVLRVLTPGGVFRIVCPMLDKIMIPNNLTKEFIKNNLISYYSEEHKALLNLKLQGLYEFAKIFHLNYIFKVQEHKFIWNIDLLKKVLKSIKFTSVEVTEIGQGKNPEYCIERRYRGIYKGHDWKEDRAFKVIYDPESIVIEAIK